MIFYNYFSRVLFKYLSVKCFEKMSLINAFIIQKFKKIKLIQTSSKLNRLSGIEEETPSCTPSIKKHTIQILLFNMHRAKQNIRSRKFA